MCATVPKANDFIGRRNKVDLGKARARVCLSKRTRAF